MNNYVLKNAPVENPLWIQIGEGDCAGYHTTCPDECKLTSVIREFIELVKTKNLTVREAQEVFLICSDYVLNCKCDNISAAVPADEKDRS